MGVQAKTFSWQTAALLAAAAAVWGWQEWQARETPAATTPAAEHREKSARYEVLRGVRWVDHRSNDGDSFRLRLADGREEIFRLYFVDVPESAFRNYGGGRSNRERIEEQAAALGLAPEATVALGAEAKRRVRELLSEAQLTLHTRWDDPFGDRRYHAFVELPDGGWLHEWLVREGLARIHTKGADLPDGTSRRAQEKRLEQLEAAARQAGEGAWKR